MSCVFNRITLLSAENEQVIRNLQQTGLCKMYQTMRCRS